MENNLPFWSLRENFSRTNKLQRFYYELLRYDLDEFMLSHSLVRSYDQFISNGVSYPFVSKKELRFKVRIPGIEYECHNSFLVIFVEDKIPVVHKKYIRFFGVNRLTKANLIGSNSLILPDYFDKNYRYIDAVHFYDFLKVILPVDYALLIQRDPIGRLMNRYCITHYHVRIDWPISESAEDLAKSLRFISKDLYENGDKYAEIVQKKLFEYYGMPIMVGGRRTAAIIASQYLKRIPCISTVYASSSESRTLIRISENGVSKSILIKLLDNDLRFISLNSNISHKTFLKKYVICKYGKYNICIFQVTYIHTGYAKPPDNGKLRRIKSEEPLLSILGQYIIPKPGIKKHPPLRLNYIYS